MISCLEIKKLFNRFDYTIELQRNTITILTGPNGFGKSTILKIISALSSTNVMFFYNANCKCKLDTCTVELSESEHRSGWKPLASILGDAAAAFGCVNRVEELVKQFLRSTVAQFLARPSV